MSIQYTQRRNRNYYTNIRLTYAIPKDLVEWLMTYSHYKTEALAMQFIKTNISDLSDEWRTLVADSDKSWDAFFISTDDVGTPSYANHEVYEGPPIGYVR